MRGIVLFTAALVFQTVQPSFAAAAPRAEIKNRLSLGYDSFIDKFTLLDEDTVESVQELYLGIGNTFTLAAGKAKAGLNSFFRYGNQTIDEYLDLDASIAPANSARIDLRSALRWKHFVEGSDYEFGNDYTQANVLLKARKEFNERFRASFKGRLEVVDYRERSRFDYDYRYYDMGLEIESGTDFRNAILFGGHFGFKETPDTAALSYERSLAEFEGRFASGELSFHLASTGDRKDYRETVKSPSWSVISFLDMSLNASNGRVYSIKGESEVTLFDRPDTIYFDTHYARAGLLARFPLRSAFFVFVEPRFARMLCSDFEEERYWESSVVLGVDILRGDDFWMSAAYEPGYRNYLAANNELYSDFYLNRISVMGSLSLPAGTTFNAFVTHEPERHSRRVDDFSVTLVSIDLTKRF